MLSNSERSMALRLVDEVAARAEVDPTRLLSSDRHQPVASARFLAASLLRHVAGWRVADIAELFQRDRSTVSQGIGRWRSLRSVDPELVEWDRDLRPVAARLVAAQSAGAFSCSWSLPAPRARGAA